MISPLSAAGSTVIGSTALSSADELAAGATGTGEDTAGAGDVAGNVDELVGLSSVFAGGSSEFLDMIEPIAKILRELSRIIEFFA